MSEHASAQFKVESWDENTSTEFDGGGKLSHAVVEQSLEGGIEGSGRAEWVMCYRPDETADFVGMQRIEGEVGGRSGSFVLTSTGTFDGKQVDGALAVVAGSGTGELGGIAGTGTFTAPIGSVASVELDLELG